MEKLSDLLNVSYVAELRYKPMQYDSEVVL